MKLSDKHNLSQTEKNVPCLAHCCSCYEHFLQLLQLKISQERPKLCFLRRFLHSLPAQAKRASRTWASASSAAMTKPHPLNVTIGLMNN